MPSTSTTALRRAHTEKSTQNPRHTAHQHAAEGGRSTHARRLERPSTAMARNHTGKSTQKSARATHQPVAEGAGKRTIIVAGEAKHNSHIHSTTASTHEKHAVPRHIAHKHAAEDGSKHTRTEEAKHSNQIPVRATHQHAAEGAGKHTRTAAGEAKQSSHIRAHRRAHTEKSTRSPPHNPPACR